MQWIRALAAIVAATATIACSSLRVRPIDDPKAEGIPFELVRQDFVVETLGFDADGKEAEVQLKRIALVARPDPSQAYRVTNDAHLLAETKFSITRNTGGTLSSVSGESKDQTAEAVTELVSLIGTVAMLASAAECKTDHPGQEDLCDELEVQKKSARVLLKDLGDIGSVPAARRPLQAKRLQEALSDARDRIAAIEAKLGAKSKGVAISRRETVTPKVVPSYALAKEEAASIKDDEIRIYLVPVDGAPAAVTEVTR